MDPIPLKRSYDSCCVPCNPDNCPQVDLEFDEGSEPEIPESGTITFRFTRKRKVEDDESESCRVTLKLTELTAVEEAPAKEAKKSPESVLDEIARSITGKSEYD